MKKVGEVKKPLSGEGFGIFSLLVSSCRAVRIARRWRIAFPGRCAGRVSFTGLRGSRTRTAARLPESSMSALICGSLAYDTIMVFQDQF
ncbi:MAG: hypothetical protein ABIR62_15410, partial [Dokdonella sp.]|uniref:hypothetical protein n=1 Tax=Dokdonella sp. TaxID=2291710 RepID=UPI003266B8C9